MNPRFTILIQTCHRCKPWSQTQREGGCAGPCPCHFDGRDIVEHAKEGNCPAGFYPEGAADALSFTLANAAHGAAGLVKAMIGMDKAPRELVDERQAICDGC